MATFLDGFVMKEGRLLMSGDRLPQVLHFKQHDRQKLQAVEPMLSSFQGREQRLFEMLQKKSREQPVPEGLVSRWIQLCAISTRVHMTDAIRCGKPCSSTAAPGFCVVWMLCLAESQCIAPRSTSRHPK